MPASRLCVPLVIVIAAACSEAAPTAVDAPMDGPSFSNHEWWAGDGYTRDSFQAYALTDCGSECTIKVGETHLLGWVIPGGADEVKGIRSPAQIAFVIPAGEEGIIGPTDTIPGPPAPGPARHAIRLAGGAAALDAMFAAAFGDADLVGPTDTIPGPPAPFIYFNGDNALMLFAVQDLMNKGVLRQTSDVAYTPLAVIWTTGSGQSTESWSAVGMLPPTDTIPGPPGPAPTATKRGR